MSAAENRQYDGSNRRHDGVNDEARTNGQPDLVGGVPRYRCLPLPPAPCTPHSRTAARTPPVPPRPTPRLTLLPTFLPALDRSPLG